MQNWEIRVELRLQLVRLQSVPATGALHDRATGSGITAHEYRYAHNTVVPDHGDFARGAILHHVKKRDDGGGWKIDVTQCVTGFVHDLPEPQFSRLDQPHPPLPDILG